MFLIAKACVLFAPIIAATVFSEENYGLIEWSLSISMILTSFASFGSGNTIAFENLRKDREPLVQFGQKYSILLSILFLITTLIFSQSLPEIGLILGISSLFVIQYALSARLKSDGKGSFAGIIDGSFYIFLLIISSVVYILDNENILSGYIFLFISLLFIPAVYLKTNFTVSSNKADIKQFFSNGVKLMLASSFSLIFFNLPKIILGNLSLNMVADFSLYFRWASISIMIYRFFSLVYFRNLYTSNIKRFDKLVFLIGLFVFLFGFIILFILSSINALSLKILSIPENNLIIQILLISTISLWSISGALEGLIYKEKMPLKHLYSSMIGIFIFILFYIFSKNFGTQLIESVTFSWFIGFTFIVISQIKFLEKKKGAEIKMKLISLYVWILIIINLIILTALF